MEKMGRHETLSANNDEIAHPEMLEYPWVKKLDEVREDSKLKGSGILLGTGRPVPFCDLMNAIEYTVSRPEIVELLAAAINSTTTSREVHLAMWFDEYLMHKYGLHGKALGICRYFSMMVIGKKYTGASDPELIRDLRMHPSYSPESGGQFCD